MDEELIAQTMLRMGQYQSTPTLTLCRLGRLPFRQDRTESGPAQSLPTVADFKLRHYRWGATPGWDLSTLAPLWEWRLMQETYDV